MNVVSYDNFTFDDNSIISGKLNLANALAFDSLVPDEMTIEVVSNDTGRNRVMVQPLPADAEQVLNWYTTSDNRGYVVMTNDIRQYVYGTPVEYTYDGNLIGKFYLKNVVRLSANTWRINMISAVGLWVNMMHLGGVYNGTTAGEIIADILDGVTYTIDADVAAVPMYGWLPVASARDNLQQVLFAIGASVMKTANGTPQFKFLNNLSTVSIPDERVFIGSSVDYRAPATKIEVTEHSYYQTSLAVTESLYDNTDGSGVADNLLVTFNDPHYDLFWVHGSTQTSVASLGWEHGANYCYVTGTGVLTGKKYGHSAKVISRTVNTRYLESEPDPNVKRVENATLVSLYNSYNVAERLAAYYGNDEMASFGVSLVGNDVRPGSKVSFTDPYDGDVAIGLVESMDLTMSGKLKADCSVLKNYNPSAFGNNFTKSTVITMDESRGITARTIRIILGQGGQAGQNGTKGQNGHSPVFGEDENAYGGAGGVGGIGGEAGKVLVLNLESEYESFYLDFHLGEGGTPGSGDGAYGNYGGETTVTVGEYAGDPNAVTYSTANGAIIADGVYEPEFGEQYSMSGRIPVYGHGGDGRDGGSGGGENAKGEDAGGRGGNIGESWIWTYNPNYTRYALGGSGGGGAYGANGGDGGKGGEETYSSGVKRGGRGGAGANARSYISDLVERGCGGFGGNGGGGGGLGGYYYYDESWDGQEHSGYGYNGVGGNGSLGTPGGKGYAIIYY